MRYTLLPETIRKALKRDYLIRTIIVLCLSISASLIISVIVLIPAYERVVSEVRGQTAIQISINNKDQNNQTLEKTEKELRIDQALLAVAKDLPKQTRLSFLIFGLVAQRGSLKINTIAISEISSTTATLLVRGVSPTRETLLSFKDRLEKDAPGTSATIPLSELTKSKDISFSLTVKRPLP